MSGNTTPRILAAAKEFNIGKETLVDFLQTKGFEIDGKRPTTKLTEDMYFALEEEYAKDKAAKRKSEKISLPKGSLLDQVDISDDKKIKATNKNKIELETKETKVVKKKEVAPPEPEAIEEKEAEAPPAVEPKEETIEEQAEVAETSTKEETGVAPEEKEVEPSTPEVPEAKGTSVEEADHISKKAPVLEGPKIIKKIDLEAINQSTRPSKKKAKAEKEKANKPKANKEQPKTKETPKKVVAKESPKKEVPKKIEKKEAEAPKEEKVEHIETKAPKLDGPKILGKIELPVREDTRPAKRKRKRIPLDNKKKTDDSGNNRGPGNRNNRNTSNRKNDRGNKRNKTSKGRTDAPTEIDAKEIQEKIRQTQAKLAGVGQKSNRALRAKQRRNKRDELEQKRAEEEMINEGTIQVTEFISVSELASLLDVGFTDIISKCMNLGIMVSINQRLDAEVIELVASEFEKEVEFIDLNEKEEEEEEEEEDEALLEERCPVVTIMGHVDHGKTSLLDLIRKSSVADGEAGGITQHIGAYKVKTESGKEIAFLDTPGHEAFTSMRARGAKVADVAIIVIAADDAIMPTTREAISHAQAASLPMVFAINKIDKEGANPDKIREQLSAMNILVEDWGGNYQCQEISAKKGLNISDLLEKILLEAELLELKANPNKQASGSIIEASLDKGRGYVTTLLVQSGTLNVGEMILSGQYYGKIKAMTNERGKRVKTAGPSTPVQILGLNGAPNAGESFKVYTDESEAKSIATHRAQILREQGLRSRKHITLDEIGRRLALGNFKQLNVIIKADFDGSAEALSDSLQKLSTEEVVVNVILKGVGQISESDIMLASASDAIILGFQVRASSQASKVADDENIEIRYYSIIYDAIADVKSAMEGLLEPKIEQKIVGNIEVRNIYKISGVGVIAGSYVLGGKIKAKSKINIIRDGIVVHHGVLSSLKRFKDDVKEVVAGYECGLSIKNYNDIKVGDVIEGIEEIEIKRKL